ncbi:Acyl-CoA dehydrogenase domain protein [Carbonactinospora thermoautotrophica]|uniref:Acyl-CoA dehydrogenase domain protein n=1 Tax=Carbonactinospora thermoautotrophica TaxID=1469144 RepID=A0A132MKR8_9ACTN|nr:Acyl-CoA dehydrogenase domain protein [Carbonactinospora thermoautotrophica]
MTHWRLRSSLIHVLAGNNSMMLLVGNFGKRLRRPSSPLGARDPAGVV